MKILKVLFALVGIAGVIAAAVLLSQFALDSRELIGAAQRYDGTKQIRDPFVTTSMLTAIGAATGLFLGLALGLPSRTKGQIRKATLDEVNADRSAAIAHRAAERTALPEGPEAQA